MRLSMLVILFLATMMSRCVHVAHVLIVSRLHPSLGLTDQTIAAGSLPGLIGVR